MYNIKQSTAQTLLFFAHDENGDAVTGLIDGSFTKRISKAGTFAAMAVTITEQENGWYSFPLSTSHSNTLGIMTIVFTNGGAKQVNLQFRVEAKLVDDLNDITTAQVNTECDTALSDYNGPTSAEMNARTLVAADYFDPAADAVANVTLVATTTNLTNNTPEATVNAATANQIADHVIRRTWANVEASSDGDTIEFRSLLGAVAKLVNKVAVSGTNLEIFRDDDSTVLGTQALVTDASAEPIISMDTA